MYACAYAYACTRQVEELELDHQHLRKLLGLERLGALRRASFCNNELTRIEGLEQCPLLEELSLEDNRLTKLEGVGSLLRLTKLDLGKNRIAQIEGRRRTLKAAALAERRSSPPLACRLGLVRHGSGRRPALWRRGVATPSPTRGWGMGPPPRPQLRILRRSPLQASRRCCSWHSSLSRYPRVAV